MGKNWKELTGAGQPVKTKGCSPGYEHAVYWPLHMERVRAVQEKEKGMMKNSTVEGKESDDDSAITSKQFSPATFLCSTPTLAPPITSSGINKDDASDECVQSDIDNCMTPTTPPGPRPPANVRTFRARVSKLIKVTSKDFSVSKVFSNRPVSSPGGIRGKEAITLRSTNHLTSIDGNIKESFTHDTPRKVPRNGSGPVCLSETQVTRLKRRKRFFSFSSLIELVWESVPHFRLEILAVLLLIMMFAPICLRLVREEFS